MAEETLEESVITSASGALETASRAILVAYGVGFFVESYFDARYGVTYLNPFHSRIAYTGIGLLLQIAAVVFVLNAESVWGVNSTYWKKTIAKSFGREKYIYMVPFAITWLTETAVLGFVVRFVFALHLNRPGSFIVHSVAPAASPQAQVTVDYLATLRFIALPLAAGIAVFVLLSIADVVRRRPNRRVRDVAAVVAIVVGLLFIYAEFRIWDPEVVAFTIYVLIIRIGFMLYRYDRCFRRKDLRLVAIGLSILLPMYYAACIYPNVLPQWGGAAKTRLWIKFQHTIVPFGVTSPAFLLEETEEGYYLLRPDDDPEAAESSRDAEGAPEAEGGAASAATATPNASATPTSRQPERLPDPKSYSAIYVPRGEVIQVLYERSDTDKP
jgi:hypothetical protein